MRAARYTLDRSLGRLALLKAFDSTKLVQDALLTIFEHLTNFWGDSRFTTWVYKFAINMALAAARRDAWKHVSLDALLEHASRPTWHLAAEARRWLKDAIAAG